MSTNELADLLNSLNLGEYAGEFDGATLDDLRGLDEAEIKEYLHDKNIPVVSRSKIRKAILEQSNTKALKPKSKGILRSFKSGRSSKEDAPAPPPPPGPGDDLPSGWKALEDSKSGRTYFWNTITNEVTWKRPTQAAPSTVVEAGPVHKYEPNTISLMNFDLKATLGTGSFGRVRLAQDNQSKKYIALKILKKSEVVRMKQVQHIKNELELLNSINHPFIVNVLGYFQDVINLYLVLEYVPGGELFSLLRRRKRFNNDVSVFYAAQIVLAFEHIHSMDITYRDLKPENLLLNKDGYLKIADFGFAKRVPGESRTYTICGTPEYLAPEIIQSRGHSTACDWWALGILIYEMLCGYPPFESDSAYGIYKKVLAGEVEYPKPVNAEAKDLLEQLLHPKPAYRLGNLKGAAGDIKSHPWFKDLDWDALEGKRLKAPYMPKVRNEADTSNFPKYSERDNNPGQVIDDSSLFSEFGDF